MRVLLAHPPVVTYSLRYMRLEPIGLERIASAVRAAGHEVHLMDLQVFSLRDYERELVEWRPEAVGISLNFLFTTPDVLDMAKTARRELPDSLIFLGGHSASFIAEELLEQSDGAVDCIMRGEGEQSTPTLLEAHLDGGIQSVPGVVTRDGFGPYPPLAKSLDDHLPARDLTPRRKRRKYYLGHFDPCVTIELSRGCPWDCSFCSAWTYYGKSYRQVSPDAVIRDLKSFDDRYVWVTDDVAFVHADHAMALAKAIEKNGIKKEYYIETRADVLLRNAEVFEYWARLGLSHVFLGIDALDEEGLKSFRKRIMPNKNFEALALARKLGFHVSTNVIVDPSWEEKDFDRVLEWALPMPEMVHLTIQTPYPGTETWETEKYKITSRDYRLFEFEHAVLPTKLPLERFYELLGRAQSALNRRHFDWGGIRFMAKFATTGLLRGQTNAIQTMWSLLVNPHRERHLDHARPARYQLGGSAGPTAPKTQGLYVHQPLRAMEASRTRQTSEVAAQPI